MPMSTTGLAAAIARFKGADARLEAELEPVVASGVHRIGEQAKSNAGFSSTIPGQEFESNSFLTGTVGFHEMSYPHGGKVRVFEGDGVAPEPFDAMVYGGPGVHQMMTHPFLGPAAEQERAAFVAETSAAVRKALS